jgi:heptosyltransferase-3
MATCSNWSATASVPHRNLGDGTPEAGGALRGTRELAAFVKSPDRAATLVIHPGALGDVLQAVPALRALRRGGSLALAGQPRLGRLFHGFGLVDAVLPFDGLGLEGLFTLDPAPASLVTRLRGFPRLISWFGARDATYPERLRALAPECVIASPLPDDASRLTVWQHLLATIGAPACHEIQPLDVPDLWRDQGTRALIELGAAPTRPLLVVHPGAGGRWKLWPVEHQARVIEQVIRDTRAQTLIHQGPADHDVGERLWRLLDGRTLRLMEPDLPLLAAVLGQASAYLGSDSGVSHLAAAVGAPAVILFPAATRERWAPWSPTAQGLTINVEVDQVDGVAAALCEQMRGMRREAG